MSKTALAGGVCIAQNHEVIEGLSGENLGHLLCHVEDLLRTYPRDADGLLVQLIREGNFQLLPGEPEQVAGAFGVNETALEYYRVAESWRIRCRSLESESVALSRQNARLKRWLVLGLIVAAPSTLFWFICYLTGTLRVL